MSRRTVVKCDLCGHESDAGISVRKLTDPGCSVVDERDVCSLECLKTVLHAERGITMVSIYTRRA